MKRAVLVIAALLPGSAAVAQVIRTETQVVLVDVAVTDKKGGYLDDLKAEEFHVWEDGKEQKITSVTRAGSSAADAARSRYTVLLFDSAGMTAREQAWAQEVARNFIDATADSKVMMAVVHFGGALRVAQTFTDNVARLKQATAAAPVSTVNPVGDATDRAAADLRNRGTLASLENLVANLETVPGRKSLVYFTPGFAMSPGYSEQVKSVMAAANRSNVAIYPVNVRLTEMPSPETTPISTLPSTRGGSRGAGGRGGIGASSAALLRGPATDLAPDSSSPLQESAAREAVLFTFAEDSGGFLVRQPDDTAMLRKIVQEQSEYYLLGYTPTAESAGACHKLRVKVDRKDTQWRARSEYCNTPPGDVLSGNPVERALEARVAGDDSGRMDATLQAAYFYTGSNVARTAVAMELDPSGIVFKRENGKFRATLDVLGIARRGGNDTAARFSDAVKLEFDTQAEVDAFKSKPYRYETQFDVTPGDATLIVVASAGEQFARLEEPLEIPPRKTSEFGMSGLVLSSVFRDANNSLDAALDELLVDDRKKLVTNGVELVMAGSKKLDEDKPAGVYFEVYEPMLADAAAREKAAVAIQMRVIDKFTGRVHRDTGLMRLDLSGQGMNPVIALGQTVPIKDLTPGLYTLEMQALDTVGSFVKRTTEFEIE